MLLTVEDFKLVLGRPVGLPAGRPFVSIDMGYSRAWSSAIAIFDSGVVEAVALCPGIPSIAEPRKT